MLSISEITKKPTTWIIIVLVLVSASMTFLYLQKADIVTTKERELTQLSEKYTSAQGTISIKTSQIEQNEKELTEVRKQLETLTAANSWFKKNWYKHTETTTDSTGKTKVTTDEGFKEEGGTSSSSSTKVDSTGKTDKVKEVKVTVIEYVHDTITITKTKDSLVYRDKIVIEEISKKGRAYVGLGGTVTEKLAIAPQIQAGFTYGFTKLSYIGFEATKSDVLDYSTGYKVGASLGLKLDF